MATDFSLYCILIIIIIIIIISIHLNMPLSKEVLTIYVAIVALPYPVFADVPCLLP